MAKKKTNNYVDNAKFYQAMVEYRAQVIKAREEELPRPLVTDYIGSCIFDIATHLSQRPNFSSYPYRNDMIGDGIENCLQYIDNFDPEKSQNPFSYFTTIVYYAFLRRISKEKKHLYTKMKYQEHVETMNMSSEVQEHDAGSSYSDGRKSEWNKDGVNEFIRDFEETKRKKK